MAMGDMPQEPVGGATAPAGPDQPPPLYTEDDRQTAMFCHASALAGVLAVGTAMWVGPLLFWMMKKDTSPIVAFHAREALNFQLNVLGYIFFPLVLGLMLSGSVSWLATILLILFALGVLYGGAMAVIVGMKASDGQWMPYPGVIKIIR